ncbi:MAG: hypothetical protein AB7K09_11635 [Planctomycetota bacterium]
MSVGITAITPLRIGFLVGNPTAQLASFATVLLAFEAHRRGHDVSLVGADDLTVSPDGRISARLHRAPAPAADAGAWLAAALQADAPAESLDQLDVLVIRLLARPKGLDEDDGRYDTWYRGRIEAALTFARYLQRSSPRTLVLNDPVGVWSSSGKLWLGQLPEGIAPRTLVSRDAVAIRRFVEAEPGGAVLKSLMGHGGEDVFRVSAGDPNLTAVVSTLLRQGFIVAQQFLPEVEQGERRLLLLDGEPLRSADGVPALYLRRHAPHDWRTNVHQGASTEACELRPRDVEIAAALKPLLLARGLWLVGVDIVGQHVLEVNAFCPGGIGIARRLTGFDAAVPIVDDLEGRVASARA